MTEPFIGEIQLFGFSFAPRGWASCNGATLAIQQNTSLFALLGTQYGGNGQTTFQLPNFTNRAGCQQGAGAGLTRRTIGETFGENSVTLTTNEMPAHTHAFTVYNQTDLNKRAASPSTGNSLTPPRLSSPYATASQANAAFSPAMIQPSGNSQPHENRQPFLALNYSIALQGVFPSFG
ncbi:tail fiber protein [Phyllobacterium sp. YR531]|uniref:phage tail protein n=1 Tax=Phyllobacterium sp. YR531 TaxID=1144343 RepID=UPI0005949A41|nr:tail fiber protein [Phyllobacterium sp. YR531]